MSDYTPLIDLSHWKKVTDWQAVASATAGVYMKASEGVSFQDEKYIPYRNACLEQGLLFGAYHFFSPEMDGEKQARQFLKVLSQAPLPELLPVLDCEQHPEPGDLAFTNLQRFLRVLFEETGLRAMIYTSGSWWDTFMPDAASAIAEQHPLWVAHYTTFNSPRLPRHWKKWTMWQYTDKGNVRGIDGGVDLNWLDGPISLISIKEEPMEKTQAQSLIVIGHDLPDDIRAWVDEQIDRLLKLAATQETDTHVWISYPGAPTYELPSASREIALQEQVAILEARLKACEDQKPIPPEPETWRALVTTRVKLRANPSLSAVQLTVLGVGVIYTASEARLAEGCMWWKLAVDGKQGWSVAKWTDGTDYLKGV